MTVVNMFTRPRFDGRIVTDLGRALLVAVWLASPMMAQPSTSDPYVRYHAPSTFSYQELVSLGEQDPLPAELAQNLKTLQTTSFVSNEAYYSGIKPRRLEIPGIGPSLRVVMWNIERGLQLDDIKTL